jgi:tetratricopeptide (TPR) repeat protein
VLIELGQPAEAIHCCQEALRLDPDSVHAYAHLGELVSQELYCFSGEQVSRMESILASGRRSAGDASRLHFLLAALFDRQGDRDRAFSHYRQGNDLKSLDFRQRNLAFDREAHRRLIDNIIATFDHRFFERVRSFGSPTHLPVFIVGMPRTGSTLVAQILSSHPRITAAGERQDLAEIVTARSPYPGWMSGLDQATAQVLAADYLDRLSRFGPQAARMIDKMPHNYLHLGSIAALFPNAYIIHCRRDVMDVCLSCYFQNFSWVSYATSLEDLGFYYRQYERLMQHWREVLPLPICEVDYEDLVHDPQRVSRDIIAFCGIKWSDRCLAFHENTRAVQTASKLQVRRPLYTTSIARWKRYESQLLPLKEALAANARVPTATTPTLPEQGPSAALDFLFACSELGVIAP